jgi:DNA-directed RNA polymerase subunit RPC12/RpoP
MSAIRTFFRHCPSCGHRFEIRLVSKKEVSDERETLKAKEYTLAQSERKDSIFTLDSENPTTLEVPEIEEVMGFKYNYRCKHCGHEWSEEAVQIRRERPKAGYTGD